MNEPCKPVGHRGDKTVLTGLVILAFVIFHLLHYTVGVVQKIQGPGAEPVGLLSLHDPQGRPDVYAMVIHGFREPWMSSLMSSLRFCWAFI